MSKQLNVDKHINACCVLQSILDEKDVVISKIDPCRFAKHYKRELAERERLQLVLDDLMILVEYPLLRIIVESIEYSKNKGEQLENGLTVYYPFVPDAVPGVGFKLLDLCRYGK